MSLESRPKSFSCCLDVGNFLRTASFPEDFTNMLQSNGRVMPPEGAAAYLVTQKAKGRAVLPLDRGCGNPCKNAARGCAGFDYAGGGCPGYYTDEPASAPANSGEQT